MAYSYGGQINLDQSIQFNNKAPLDIRVTVPTLEDLAQIEQPYVGLITYVVEEETAYICKSVGSTTGTSEWIKIKGSSAGSVYMGDIRPELDPDQEFDEDTENRAIWIDTHDDFTQDNYYGPDAAETMMSLRKAYFALKEQVNILNNLVTAGVVPGKITDSARNKMRWNIPSIVPDAYVEALMNDGYLYDRKTGNIYEYIPEFNADGTLKNPYDENGNIINMPGDDALIQEGSGDDDTEVKPSYPVDSEPTVPHVSVKYGTWDEISNHRQDFINGELVWCTDESRNCMYIYMDGTFKVVGNGSGGSVGPENPDDDMDKIQVQEIIAEQLDKIENGVTFIPASGDGIQYKVDVDDEGNLKVYNKKLDTPMKWPSMYMWESGYNAAVGVMINSFYAGGVDNDEHSYQPCSHNFVELSNMAQNKNTGKMIDINLKGFSLCYFDGANWYECPLDGEIKGGGTYLIRGAQCSVMEANTTLLKVKTYDKQWINTVESVNESGEATKTSTPMKFSQTKGTLYLVYTGSDHKFYKIDGTGTSIECGNHVTSLPKDQNTLINVDNNWCAKGFADMIGYQKNSSEKINHFEKKAFSLDDLCDISDNPVSEVLFRRWYLMDPVTQSNPKDGITSHNNVKYMTATTLRGGTIPDYMDVTEWTPKASFEKKTIKMTRNHFGRRKGPGILTCTFGCQATYKDASHPATRGFCWVSNGYHDEYIQIRKQGTTTWYKFYSLTGRVTNNTAQGGLKYSHVHTTQSLFGFYIRDRWESPYDEAVTTHKAIITGFTAGVYEYQVKRDGDDEWQSKIRKFTVRTDADVNNGFTFMQTTDQQGASWEEYEVWNLSARKIKQLCEDQVNNNKNESGVVVPLGNTTVNISDYQFVVNTGDICYNGSRPNEWIDYFDGYEPMDDREEMLCIGNNDLAPIQMYDIGTGGETPWKINVKVIDYFYAVETQAENPCLFTGDAADGSGGKVTFRMPGLYSYNYGRYHYLCVLSEIRTGSTKVELIPVKDENGNPVLGSDGKPQYTVKPTAAKATTVSDIFGMIDSPRQELTGTDNANARYIYDLQESWIIKDLLLWKGVSTTSASWQSVDPKRLNFCRQLDELVGKCQDCFVYTHEMPFNITSQSAYGNYGMSPGATARETAKAYLNRFHNFEYQRCFKLWGIRMVFGGHKHTVAMTRAVYDAPLNYNPITKKIEGAAASLLKSDIYPVDKDHLFYDFISESGTFQEGGTFSNVASFKPFIQLTKDDFSAIGHWSQINNRVNEVYNNSSSAVTFKFNNTETVTLQPGTFKKYTGTLTSPGTGTALGNPTARVEIVDKTNAPYYVMCHATGFKNKSNSDLAAYAEIIPWEYYYVKGDNSSLHDQCFPYFTVYVVKGSGTGLTIEVNMFQINGLYYNPDGKGTGAGYWDLMKIYKHSLTSVDANREAILSKSFVQLYSGQVSGGESGKAITIGAN